MAYSDFTNLVDVTTRFELTLIQQPIVLVEQAKERKPSELLSQILQKNMKSNVQFKSEKAKGELVISPMLVEVTDLYENTSLFSGETFDVDRSRGLNGVCDFLISKSPIDIEITNPVAVVIEAKKSDLKSGLAQCAACLFAAQLFNQDTNMPLYGAVTNATQWSFMCLLRSDLVIDPQIIVIPPIDKVLGILSAIVGA